jgi:hypothetical protein
MPLLRMLGRTGKVLAQTAAAPVAAPKRQAVPAANYTVVHAHSRLTRATGSVCLPRWSGASSRIQVR